MSAHFRSFAAASAIAILVTLGWGRDCAAEFDASNNVDQLTANLVRDEYGTNPCGDLQFSLPIMVVPGRNGLDFPIYLSYQSGIRWKQEATWVGLGFNMQIGSISRSVQYRVDEQRSSMFSPPLSYYLDNNPLQAQGQGVFREPSGGDPIDRYMLHLPEGSHPLDMIIDENNIAHCYLRRWNGWHMGFNEQEGFNTYDSQNLSGFIPNFVLWKTDGTRWRFKHKSNLKIYGGDVSHPHLFEFPISWELTDVLSPDYVDMAPLDVVGDNDLGSWIKIEYNDFAHGQHGTTPLDYGTRGNVRLGESTFGSRVENVNGVNIFPTFSTSVLYDYSSISTIETPSHIATFYTSPRSDYIPDNVVPSAVRRLDRIELAARARPDVILHSVQFTYADGSPQSPTLKMGCLTLSSITIDDQPPMAFEYAPNPVVQGNHDDADFIAPEAYNITAVRLPTGGRIEYQWEAGSFNWFSEAGTYSLVHGGRAVERFKTYYVRDAEPTMRGRLHSVVRDDGMGNRAEWTFDYGEGTRCLPPVSPFRHQHETHMTSLLGSIIYRSITTHLPGARGSVVNRFINGSTWEEQPVIDYIEGQPGPEPDRLPGESRADYLDNDNYLITGDDCRGLVLRREVLDENGTRIYLQDFGYGGYIAASYREPQVLPGSGQGGFVHFVHESIPCGVATELTWQDGLTFNTTRDFNHDNNLPWQEIRTGSDGRVDRTTYTYAYESSADMTWRRMFSQPRMSFTGASYDPSGTAIRAVRTDWTVTRRGANNDVQAYPTTQYEWRERGVHPGFGGINDPDFEAVKQAEFDDYGNVIREHDANGAITQTVYGDNASTAFMTVAPAASVAMVDDFETRAAGIVGTMHWGAISGGGITDGMLVQLGAQMYAPNHTALADTFCADLQMYLHGSDAWGGLHFGTQSDQRSVGYLLKCHEDGLVELLHNGTVMATRSTGVAVGNGSLHRLAVTRTDMQCIVELDGAEVLRCDLSSGVGQFGYVNIASEGTGAAFDNYRVYGPRSHAAMTADGTADEMAYPLYSAASRVGVAVDANGVARYTEFDSNGRPTGMRDGTQITPGEYESPLLVTSRIEYWNPGANMNHLNPNRVRTRNLAMVNGQPDTRVAATYLDGLGRKIQVAQELGSEDLIAASALDSLGNPKRTYRTYKIALGANAHTYDGGFAAHSAGAHDDAGGFPYSEFEYTDDPRQWECARSAPGAAFRLDGGHASTSEYGLNAAGEVPGAAANRYYRKVVTDENGSVTKEFRDSWGNLVYVVRDPSGLNLSTQFTYDRAGQLVTTQDALGRQSTSTYDTRGRETSSSSPDAGTVRKKYDRAGNLRFLQDAAHSSTRNAVGVSQQLAPSQVINGSFELTQPGYVVLNASIVQLQVPPDRIELVVKSASGAPLKTIVAGDQAPADVSESIALQPGHYLYSASSIAYGTTAFAVNCDSGFEFLYQKHDVHGRVIEVGEALQTGSTRFTDENAVDANFPTSSYRVLREFTYDTPQSGFGFGPQRNVRGRLVVARSSDDAGTASTTVYSYDEQGRVEWCGSVNGGATAKVSYVYDWAGEIVEKHVVVGPESRSVHYFFNYDGVGRLADVFASIGADSTGLSRVHDAHYEYTDEGQVQRLELGDAQGVDYRYNPRGWITGINASTLDPALDPGGDGPNGTPPDRFGMEIGYDNIGSIGSTQGAQPQYDGHASWCAYSIADRWFHGISKYPQFQYEPTELVGRTYQYDRIGRLTKADFGFCAETEPVPSGMLWRSASSYDEQDMNYDALGNLLRLKRYGDANALMDNLTYTYGASNNRLDHVDDTVAAGVATVDADDQAAGNYAYLGTGAAVADVGHGIGLILYDAFGLPGKVYSANGSASTARYDAFGHRVYRSGAGAPGTTYFYGAAGELVAVDTAAPSGKLQVMMPGAPPVGEYRLDAESWSRHFCLRDEHGSVRVWVDDAGMPESSSDYYVYGGDMPMRCADLREGYDPRYLGNELDGSSGYSLTDERNYDVRIARFMAVDRASRGYPSWSPYVYALCNPIGLSDAGGLSTRVDVGGRVSSVVNDGDLGVYQVHANGAEARVGETLRWQSFLHDANGPSGTLLLGESWDPMMRDMMNSAHWRLEWSRWSGDELSTAAMLAAESSGGRSRDIKMRSDLAPSGPFTGKLWEGRYASAVEIGNALAGATGAEIGRWLPFHGLDDQMALDGMQHHLAHTGPTGLRGNVQDFFGFLAFAARHYAFGYSFGEGPCYGDDVTACEVVPMGWNWWVQKRSQPAERPWGR